MSQVPRHLQKHSKPEEILASIWLYILEDFNSSLPATLCHVGKEEKNALKLVGGNIADSALEYSRALLFFTAIFDLSLPENQNGILLIANETSERQHYSCYVALK